MKFTDYFAIYVTAPNEEGSMKYFEYNILEDRLLEISAHTWACYKEAGAYSNLVTDENCLRNMIKRIQEKEN